MIPGSRAPRPAGSPAYYLGRPARLWIAAAHRRRPAAAGTPRPPAAGVPVVDPGEAFRQATGAGLVVHRADPLNAEAPLTALTRADLSHGGAHHRGTRAAVGHRAGGPWSPTPVTA
jgi:hypothetical protein